MAEGDGESREGAASLDELAASPSVAGREFRCCRDGARAATVRLHGGAAGGWLVAVDSFVCMTQHRVPADVAAAVGRALAEGLAGELHAIDLEFAPFFCPVCAESYCGDCWTCFEVFDDDFPGWLDSVRGRCPAGHERMLMD